MRHALISLDGGIVENIVELPEQENLPDSEKWQEPEGMRAVPSETAEIGYHYEDGEFTKPPVVIEPEHAAENRRKQISDLMALRQSVYINAVMDGMVWPPAWRDLGPALREALVNPSMPIPDFPKDKNGAIDLPATPL